jgi:hypothetical protein
MSMGISRYVPAKEGCNKCELVNWKEPEQFQAGRNNLQKNSLELGHTQGTKHIL